MYTDTALARVLHEPVSYYRPWATPYRALAPGQRSAMNAWLAQTMTLQGAGVQGLADPLVQRLVADWDRIPCVAWLLACAKQRRRLMGSRFYLSQPPTVHHFLRLPFEQSPPVLQPLQNPQDLLGWGGGYLQAGLRCHLPPWLHSRLGLWFAGLPSSSHGTAAAVHGLDMSCFWSAWSHAADLPRDPA